MDPYDSGGLTGATDQYGEGAVFPNIENIDFKSKNIICDKEGLLLILKAIINNENITAMIMPKTT